jgi:hypothetical protein
MQAWKQSGFRPVSHLVWVKSHCSRQGYARSFHEVGFLLAKGNPPKPRQPIRDVLPWKYTGNFWHPNEKPVAGIRPLIEAYSNPGDIVLDPFAGSGTTALAALACFRRFILIEQVLHDCRVARERIGDLRDQYPVIPATEIEMKETPASVPPKIIPPKEYKIVALRECPLPEGMHLCDTPERAADYWKLNIATNPYMNPEVECFAVLMLNTRRRVKGHQLVSMGTLDTILVHPREVFRAAVIVAAAAIVLMHNHPSGEPTPSEADIKVTRDLIRAGQLLKIEVLDHVIVGRPTFCSLRQLGYWAV